MADYITTYSGAHFAPLDPSPDQLHIRDIAHALSLLCRGNGHVKVFFSVGQHCIRCAKEAAARGCSDRIILASLLHDASEAYLSDVPRPFKKSLPEYRTLENNLLNLIYEKYLGSSLTPEEERIIQTIDDDLLWFDLSELLEQPAGCPKPLIHVSTDYTFRPFEEVEQEYLELFAKYRLL